MNLEKSLRQKYGESVYRRSFSSDFKEAVKGVDSIARIISKAVKKKEKKAEEACSDES